jgi:hypothetical protein
MRNVQQYVFAARHGQYHGGTWVHQEASCTSQLTGRRIANSGGRISAPTISPALTRMVPLTVSACPEAARIIAADVAASDKA